MNDEADAPRRQVKVARAVVIGLLIATGLTLLAIRAFSGGDDGLDTEPIEAAAAETVEPSSQIAPVAETVEPTAPATTSPTTAPTATSTAPTATTAPAVPDVAEVTATDIEADGSAVESIFAEAAANRQLIVNELTAQIEAGNFGINATGVLRGPDGFGVDTSECQDTWDDTAGITSSSIRIGHTSPRSGPSAALSDVGRGFANYLSWVNSNDPLVVDGVELELELAVRDDAHLPERTFDVVYELLDDDDVFSVWTQGTEQTLAVYDALNIWCVPHPFVASPHPAWADPANHPWTTGLSLSTRTEALLWGEWIAANLSEELPVTVAGLVANDTFGLQYERAFRAWAEQNPSVVSDFVAVHHNPVAEPLEAEVAAALTQLAAAEPDVLVLMTRGEACALGISQAFEMGLSDAAAAAFTSRPCADVDQNMVPAGDGAKGWMVVGGGVKDTSGAHSADPFVSWMHSNLAAAGFDPANPRYAEGYLHGYPYVEALRIAAELPGGLSRSNFMLAVRSLELDHPLLLDGVRFSLNGAADAYAVEGSEFLKFDATGQQWVVTGTVIDLNGQSPTCRGYQDGWCD